MVFHSLAFSVFFVIVYSLYLTLKHRQQKWLLLMSSCLFYASWSWRFLSLILITTLIAYASGLGIHRAKGIQKKRLVLLCGVLGNLVILALFKYYNFFVANLEHLFRFFDLAIQFKLMAIVLPVGISFYTFKAISYSIDVYRGHSSPAKSFFDLALFVSFFPALVAGPIDRAGHLIPQFEEKRIFDYESAVNGFKLFAWGLFKKVAIADRLAIFVNHVYNNAFAYQGISLVVATAFFTYQIFCDFSAYSDMAIGIAQTMGYNLKQNFNHPFCAASVSDFWRRWHISMTTWITDYVYMPVVYGVRDWGNAGIIFALILTFSLIGLWHGANWTFVIFGLLHGVIIGVEVLTRRVRKNWSKHVWPSLYKAAGIIFTFCFFSFSLIFFRSKDVGEAMYIISHLFTGWSDLFASFGDIRTIRHDILLGQYKWDFIVAVALIILLECMQYLERKFGGITNLTIRLPGRFRWTFYYMFVLSTMLLGVFNQSAFIYFQF